ncbi:alpha/beta fold hydrolase [uncultured Sneathiella sp.]|uniref:alpha/beta fold hydrolase n=1 Tax=uncultured Sneathiella sp. TaxID=879315 RepID=UPI0030ED291D|tara:strand:+ start:12181 stop:13575 length:1395 start_codon:yes stop_codon:yes gene_type:complete
MRQQRLAAILSLDVVGFSRMMQSDSPGLLKTLNIVFRKIVTPAVTAHNGRVVKLLGDGALIEFSAAIEALDCAVAIQRALRSPDLPFSHAEPIRLRAGIHVGDVVVEAEDVFGDAVNIAARLQAAAEPGGILISRIVRDLAGSYITARLRREGMHSYKGIEQPIEVLSVDLSDLGTQEKRRRISEAQEIKFCTTKDKVRLAWTTNGDGPPIVKAPNWISHLQLDWRSPGFAPMTTSIANRYSLIRFDARGNGLSDWEVAEISADRFVDDLEAVFDAAGIDRAPIISFSQGAAIAAAFAARQPERVSAIVMIGGYAKGRAKRGNEHDARLAEAFRAMMRAGWDDDYPSLRDLLAQTIVPGASEEDRRRFAEDMREMISPENLGRYREVLDNMDIMELLGEVRAPCLVAHCRHDRMQPLKEGQRLAAALPNARFVSYDSPNHLVPENDPAWPLLERNVQNFLAEHS